MTDRSKCEEMILGHLKEIQKEYKKMNPKAGYLTMVIHDDGSIQFNNEYWSVDSDFPIDRFEDGEND